MHAQPLQSFLTLHPGYSDHASLQARILEWVATPSSRGSSRPRDWTAHLLCLPHCRWILHCRVTGEAPRKCTSLPESLFFFFHCLLFHSGQCKLFILDALAYLHKGRSYEGLDSVLKLMKAAPCSQALESESHLVLSDSLRPHGLHSPWNSPGQNTGVGGLSLHQGIFPTQELNPGLQHRRRTLPAEPQGSPKEALVDSHGFNLSITPFP